MSKITQYLENKPVYSKEIALKYIEKVENFLKEKVEAANAKNLIVGISGGIDSALVYAIAKRVFPNNTIAVVMPIISMTESDLSHISELEKAFNDSFKRVDLTNTFLSISETLNLNNDLAIANIKPRLRMTTLYAIAQENSGLVLGTDNADEVYIGYFTKFGDGGADLLPICNFTKGEVKFLASLLNVPSSIIDKKPSAGLWEGQTDENELGFTYDDLDFYLNNRLTNPKLVSQKLSEETISKIEYKHKTTQHKRDNIYKPENIE
ncbi:NAD(+) synthase [Mycoplasmopsis glycophila]|uniref:NH(3)-dependent NAD(+) synthetase n=1 Tax=Mycoplasmopsis glycophila TaxID=171285 RepID=A0A449AV68_9BACT|nr:NAD(+) synthase [Mycoplasmopsis glycophila]VEU70401.1 NAD+ synthetase [Mycoplasmopsis glycophila]